MISCRKNKNLKSILKTPYAEAHRKSSNKPRIARFKLSAIFCRYSKPRRWNIGDLSGSSYARRAIKSCINNKFLFILMKKKIKEMHQRFCVRKKHTSSFSTYFCTFPKWVNLAWANSKASELARKQNFF